MQSQFVYLAVGIVANVYVIALKSEPQHKQRDQITNFYIKSYSTIAKDVL